jgi:hypothetical protein
MSAANGLPMKPAELLVDVALPHGVAVAVPQQNEAGREGQLRSDQLAMFAPLPPASSASEIRDHEISRM